MIRTIATKEFLEKILDFRVIISFVVAIGLTIVSVVVIEADYQVKKAEYDQAVAKAQSELRDVKVFSQYQPKVFFTPSPLSIFSKGIDAPAPITETITISWIPYYEPLATESNPLMQIYSTLDLVTVIRILFSLLVVLLTFDSFSGEKEHGTLKQTLSNPVARIKLLFGKFLGTLMIVGLVVILTFIVTLIVLRLSSDISLSAEDYVRVLLIAISAFIYLAIFAALGIFASIMLRHSATSLVLMLLLWFFVCILQPNLNTYIAGKLTQLTAPKQAPAQQGNLEADYIKKLEKLQDQYRALLDDSTKKRYVEGSIDWGGLQIYTPLADGDYDILEYTMKQIPIYREADDYAKKAYELAMGLRSGSLERPLYWKGMLELLSPAAFFTHSIAVLSRTDYDNVQDFYKHVHRYREEYLTYLDQKGVYSTNAHLFFTRLPKDEINPEATERRLADYVQDSASVPWTRLEPPLNVSDAPVFGAQQSALLTDIGKSAEKLISVPLFLVLIFLWTGRNLKKYDPR